MSTHSGPWDIPLRQYITTLPIVVMIFNIQNDCIEKEIVIDYGNADDRKFLGKISFWAYSNGRSVECISKTDYDKENKK